jgi:hypothetical protein
MLCYTYCRKEFSSSGDEVITSSGLFTSIISHRAEPISSRWIFESVLQLATTGRWNHLRQWRTSGKFLSPQDIDRERRLGLARADLAAFLSSSGNF